jgi:superfamily II DNA or RNA helicase
LNVRLSKADYDQIERGLQSPGQLITNRFLEDLQTMQDDSLVNHARVLGWLIANKFLEIRVGYVQDKMSGGALLHQKTGILTDRLGNLVSFSGSNNESAYGWMYNSEKFKVFFSWEDGNCDFIRDDIADFEELWNDRASKTRVVSFPEAVKNHLIEIAPTDNDEVERLIRFLEGQQDAVRIKLRGYQRDAISSWFDKGCRGIFDMATATGKTYTALGALLQLLEREEKLVTIIACPFLHLVRQWEDSLQAMGFKTKTIEASSSNPKWRSGLLNLILDVSLRRLSQFIILTTHDTLSSDNFIELMEEIECPILLIADEVHGLGAVQRSEGLLARYQFRLGLSATPTRYFDEVGSEKLRSYFQPLDYEWHGDTVDEDKGTVFSFPLHRAINEVNPDTGETFLCPYKYYPLFVELTPEHEMKQYMGLSRQIAALYLKKHRSKEEDLHLESLLRKRQNVLKNATNKYSAFKDLIEKLLQQGTIDHTLVYCSPQQRKTTQEILHETSAIKQHKFTCEEDATKKQAKFGWLTEREYILRNFAQDHYQVLVAIRCLDEGVDVPVTKNAVLMCSSGNPREYIQRRGRILRRFPGKKEATIYDIAALPILYDNEATSKTQKEIVRKQLERIKLFAKDALNQSEVLSEIFEIEQQYRI